MFRCLMDMVGKNTNTIEELETLVAKGKENSYLPERTVDYEEAHNDDLCVQIQRTNKTCEELASS